jgi:transposase
MKLEFTGQTTIEQLSLNLELNEAKSGQAGGLQTTRKVYRSYRPDQTLMLEMPKSILPENHLAWFVRSLVARLDLSEFFSGYRVGDGRGQQPYDPAMMLTLLMYCYCTERQSSRDIEQATYDDIPCRMITGDQHPDHTTIANFRKRHLAALDHIFGQVLTLAEDAGLVDLKNVATDGSKVKANASKHRAMSYDRMCLREEKWEKEIPEIKAQIAAGIWSDSPLTPSKLDELKKDLEIREKRLVEVKKSKAVLEAEARERTESMRKAAREAALLQGKKPRRKVWDNKPKANAQRNFTDPDSKIMPSKKTFVQGYNAQIAVDGRAQIVVGQYVTQAANDKKELLPMASQIQSRFGRLPDNFLADSGFFSEANLTAPEWETMGPTNLFIPPGKEQKGKQAPAPIGRIPKDISVAERMRRKLRTKVGHGIYRLRKSIVEPVFGQIKCALDFDEFSLRGLTQIQQEWSFVCTIHNLLKIFRSSYRFAPQT